MIDSRVLGGRSNRASRRFRPPERGSGRKFLGGRARRRTLVRPDRRPDHEIQEIRKCSATLCFRRGFILPIKYLKIQTVEDQLGGSPEPYRQKNEPEYSIRFPTAILGKSHHQAGQAFTDWRARRDSNS
jgi:hypothetical protein